MSELNNQIYGQEYFNYLHNRSRFRKAIRILYLKDVSSYCEGKTIDFGCGVGELLSLLDEESIGFEVNKVITQFCKAQGKPIHLYRPEQDQYEFRMIPENKYSCFTMNHVLEHLEDPDKVIKKIFKSCYRLGIRKIIFTVPGFKGYQTDDTHKTFIDLDYFRDHGLLENNYFHFMHSKYFPVNFALFSQVFAHNELRIIFKRKNY